MNVLILYASVEGQTRKIAGFTANEVRRLGHDATTVNADDMGPIDLADFDAVILAAPVHQRRHPQSFEAVLGALHDELAERKTLMLSVSLSAAFPEGMEDAQDFLLEMKMRTGLKPDRELLVGGAVRSQAYDYFAMQVVRHVVLRGRDFDPSEEEHEFTDWAGLSEEIRTFLKEVRPAEA